MLISTRNFMKRAVNAKDGEIGNCKDILFDDSLWGVRFIEVKTGSLLFGRRLLISPIGLEQVDIEQPQLTATHSKQELLDGPSIEEHIPVSRQYEATYFAHYNYGFYWGGNQLWGNKLYPSELVNSSHETVAGAGSEQPHDKNLRSANEVIGYDVQSQDETAGCIKDFLIDPHFWRVKYCVVDYGKWLRHRYVVIPVEWIDSVYWIDRSMLITANKTQVELAPNISRSMHVNADNEKEFYRYYNRKAAFAETTETAETSQ